MYFVIISSSQKPQQFCSAVFSDFSGLSALSAHFLRAPFYLII